MYMLHAGLTVDMCTCRTISRTPGLKKQSNGVHEHVLRMGCARLVVQQCSVKNILSMRKLAAYRDVNVGHNTLIILFKAQISWNKCLKQGCAQNQVHTYLTTFGPKSFNY